VPVILNHERLRVYGLSGDRTLLLWCRDRANSWRSELANSIPPVTLTDQQLDVSALIDPGVVSSARSYDPWQDRWTSLSIEAARLSLPSFQRSLVVRLTVTTRKPPDPRCLPGRDPTSVRDGPRD
jgi:hypothetical protein